jgi:hypothetical protein
MKTYNIYTADGSCIASVKADEVIVREESVILRLADKIVAVMPLAGQFVLAEGI